MRYFLCLIPPVAVLACGKPGQAFFNFILTLLFYFPGLIHAILVVSNYYNDKRTDRIISAINTSSSSPSPLYQPNISQIKPSQPFNPLSFSSILHYKFTASHLLILLFIIILLSVICNKL